MKYTITLILLLLAGQISLAQQFSRSVFSNGGSESNPSGYYFSHTIGEVINTSLYSNNKTYILTQGYQQSGKFVLTSIKENPLAEMEVNLYPNPTRDYIYIQTKDINAPEVHLVLYDLYGKEMSLSDQIVYFDKQIRLNLSHLTKGTYVLQGYHKDSKKKFTYRIIKIY